MLALVIAPKPASAQNDNHGSIGSDIESRFDDSALQRIMPTRFGGRSRLWREEAMKQEEQAAMQQQLCDSLLPADESHKTLSETVARCPSYFGGWYDWGLHKGLNVQLGASVFAQFGKGAHSGAGFQQNIALMYAMPVTDKLSVAVGGYLNNINYSGDNWRDAGLSAVVGYRFNDHWEAYIYGQKSISNHLPSRLRYSLYDGYCGGLAGPAMGRLGGFGSNFFGFPAYSAYDLNGIGDRIGATVRYNVNNNLSFEVSVEKRWMPSNY